MRGHRSLSQPPPRLVTWLTSSSLLLVLWLAVSPAQVRTTLTSDGTLGTTVAPHGNVYTITGGTRPGNGPNLFHSFDRFSVGTNETASFTGPAGITRILSRVTGGQRSEIDGTLQSTIPGADMYLLNPSGLVFGPHATLDVQGSFHVSTADYLRLADGARFSARLSETSTLSVAPPAAFGFLGPTPAPITMQGSTLQVPVGQTMAVIGGDIAIVDGALHAPSGRITLGSVASAGEVLSQPLGQSPDLQVESFARLGKMYLGPGARLDVSGVRGGSIVIRSGQLQVDTATLVADTVGDTDGAKLGMDIVVQDQVVVTHRSSITTATRAPGGRGAAGDIHLAAGSVRLEEGAFLSSSTFGPGQGGTVLVTATDPVLLTGPQTGLFTSTRGFGRGGDIVLQAPRVTLAAGATISTESTNIGRVGDITIDAQDSLLSTNGTVATRSFQADGGNIAITAGHLLWLRDSAIIAETAGANFRLSSQFIVLQSSEIVADVFQRGGGNVLIDAQRLFFADPMSVVLASVVVGVQEVVKRPVEMAFAQIPELSRNRCVARLREGTVSQFMVGGRDGVPLEPGSLLLSPLARVGHEGGDHPGEGESNTPDVQHGRARYAQAQAPAGVEVECARWMRKPGTPGPPKRSR